MNFFGPQVLIIVFLSRQEVRKKEPKRIGTTLPLSVLKALKAIDVAKGSVSNIRFVLDSITGLTSICQHSMLKVVRFLQVLVAKIRAANGKAIFVVVPEVHDAQLVNRFRLEFDGILEMKEDETGKQVKRLFRIFCQT